MKRVGEAALLLHRVVREGHTEEVTDKPEGKEGAPQLQGEGSKTCQGSETRERE